MAVALDTAETAVETESELLSRDRFPDSLSQEYAAQVANLQNLERLKGDLHSALLDLDEPDTEDGFSVCCSVWWLLINLFLSVKSR